VHSVENDSLTGGYKSNFPFFHKLFLKGVENSSGDFPTIIKKLSRKSRPERRLHTQTKL